MSVAHTNRLNRAISNLFSCLRPLIKESTDAADIHKYYEAIIPPVKRDEIGPVLDYFDHKSGFFRRTTAAALLRAAGINPSAFPEEFVAQVRDLVQKQPEIYSSDNLPPEVVDKFLGIVSQYYPRYPQLQPLADKLGERLASRLGIQPPSYSRFNEVYSRLRTIPLPSQEAATASFFAKRIRESRQVDPGTWYYFLRSYLKGAAKQGRLDEAYRVIFGG